MAKIPITHAIDSGAWFKYHGENISCGEYCGPVDLRFRILAFEKICLNDIDEPNELNIREYNTSEGDYWKMVVEVVNLTTMKIKGYYLGSIIVIIDHDGFEFCDVNDSHLTTFSKYAKKSGLYDLWVDLTPKIKYKGSVAYFLPKEDGAKYYLSANSLRGGVIQEI